ncbi:hypothetical protein TOPH_04249, partial [Tolypocladium ophioglossoides CBS 100239]
MAMIWLSVLLSTLAFWGSAIRRRSPYSYETTAPTRQWADHPIKLDDLLIVSATHMALLHNSLIRGYNSIVLQAPHVREEDKADFAGYSKTWVRFIKSHHDDEEDVLFPEMKSMLNDQHVWGDSYKEHESFLDGLKELESYLCALPNASAWTAGALLERMDSFRKPLEHHLHHEVSVMAAMAAHPNAPQRDSLQGAVASGLLKAWGKNTVRKAGLSDVVPFFLLNADGTAEGGLWRAWPPMPRPVRWGMVNL